MIRHGNINIIYFLVFNIKIHFNKYEQTNLIYRFFINKNLIKWYELIIKKFDI